MANVSEKFGLRPYKTLGGHAWNNQQNEYPIASGYSTAIFQGDLVVPTGAGNIERYDVSGGATVKPIGVFNGVFYTDPTTKKPTFGNYYPGSIAASDIVANVIDDPNTLFECQSVAGTTGQAVIGANANAAGNANGNSTSGLSSCKIDAPNAAATAEQLRIVDVTADVDNNDISSNNVNFVVRINEHAYTTLTGI